MAAFILTLDAVVPGTGPEPVQWLRRWMIAGWNNLLTCPSWTQKNLLMKLWLVALIAKFRALRRMSYSQERSWHTGLESEFGGNVLGDEIIEAIDSDALAHWTAASFDLFLILV